MKIKFTLLPVLLLLSLLLSACSDTAPSTQNTTDINTESTITDETTAVSEPDLFEAVRQSKEDWLSYGLSAYESQKETVNLKDFFSNPANMTYLTLYDDMFAFDKAKSIPVAEALFRFICDEYGVDALLNTEKRIDYKTAYLKSLGLDMEYMQPFEAESFFLSMDFSSDDAYKYIISFDNINYYFKDFDLGSPSSYHAIMYYSTAGLFEMIEYLKNNDLDELFDTDRKFNFYMTFDGSGYSKTINATGDMYINDSHAALHEAVHAMGIKKNDNIWLSEGICDYFGKSLGFNVMVASSYIQALSMAKQGYFDERANSGDKSAILCKTIYEQYTAKGGRIDSVESFDLRLYTDVIAKIQLDTDNYATIGETYKAVNKKDCTSVGRELSYEQATSLVIYLADIYGIENILEAYKTQDIQGVFGKDYNSLKSDWLEYLN